MLNHTFQDGQFLKYQIDQTTKDYLFKRKDNEMKTNRLFKWTIVPVVVLAAFVVLQAFSPHAAPEINPSVYFGRGEYQRQENQVFASQSIGIGDLRLFEAQNIIPITGASKSSSKVIGMGDLRLYEKQSQSLMGIGNLRRFEATH
jgi:hypothetical protein